MDGSLSSELGSEVQRILDGVGANAADVQDVILNGAGLTV